MKKLVIFSALAFSALAISAQKKLMYEDVTPDNSVYVCEDRSEAMVEIRSVESFNLTFDSNADQFIQQNEEQKGTETIYQLVFPIRQGMYKNRELTIFAPGFDRLSIFLGDLQLKQKKVLKVYDPNSAMRSPFYTNMDKGREAFDMADYAEAQSYFLRAKQCAEYETNSYETDRGLEKSSNMVRLSREVESLLKKKDYRAAMDSLQVMSTINPKDEEVRNKYSDVLKYHAQLCAKYNNAGLEEYDHGNMEEAKYNFTKLLEAQPLENTQITNAEYYLDKIKRKELDQFNHVNTLFYQRFEDRPIGFTFAACDPTTTSVYLSSTFNRQCIDKVAGTYEQKYDEPTIDYRVGASIGWTIPIYVFRLKNEKPLAGLWAYTTIFSYLGGGYTQMDNSTQWYNALAPEAGAILRLWRFAVNYKAQYVIPLKINGIDNPMEKGVQHSLGIGFTW